jgi:D-alanine-D-alanine ligase
VVRALRAGGHTVYELDPAGGVWSLAGGTEVVFLALHGTYGEDGTAQEALDRLGVPYTGCGAEASRIAFDKAETKRRLLAAGVPTPRYVVVSGVSEGWPEGWRPPAVMKPVRQGSSVGLSFLKRLEDWGPGLVAAGRHDSEVLVEEWIAGRELTVGILGGRALPVVEVRPKRGGYDFQNKYTAGATDYFCPAALGSAVTAGVQEAALGAFAAVGCRDYARVDVMLDGEARPWVLEVNTLPGMTETSLLPKAAAAAGIGFGELCERMLELALARRPGRGVS